MNVAGPARPSSGSIDHSRYLGRYRKWRSQISTASTHRATYVSVRKRKHQLQIPHPPFDYREDQGEKQGGHRPKVQIEPSLIVGVIHLPLAGCQMQVPAEKAPGQIGVVAGRGFPVGQGAGRGKPEVYEDDGCYGRKDKPIFRAHAPEPGSAYSRPKVCCSGAAVESARQAFPRFRNPTWRYLEKQTEQQDEDAQRQECDTRRPPTGGGIQSQTLRQARGCRDEQSCGADHGCKTRISFHFLGL